MDTKFIFALLLLVLLNLLSCNNSKTNRIYGIIYRSDTGERINGVLVRLGNAEKLSTLRPGETAIVSETLTNSDGAYEFSNLGTGRYYMIIAIPKSLMPCNYFEDDFMTVDGWYEKTNIIGTDMVAIASPIESAKYMKLNERLNWDVNICCAPSWKTSSPMINKTAKQPSIKTTSVLDSLDKINNYLDSILNIRPDYSLIGEDIIKMLEFDEYIKAIEDLKNNSPIESKKIEDIKIKLGILARKVVPNSK